MSRACSCSSHPFPRRCRVFCFEISEKDSRTPGWWNGTRVKQLMRVKRQSQEEKKEVRKRRDSTFASTSDSLPDVLSMLVNRHEVLLVRISWYLAGFLTFRLDIAAREWPHRDQFQVYGLDLLLLPRLYRKRETV